MTATRIGAAFLAAVVAGCTTTAYDNKAVPPATARWTTCNTASPGARCDVRVVRDANGSYSCGLGRFSVDPDYLELRCGRPVNIQWDVPAPFAFCDGDGVDLKDASASGRTQVYESFGSDDKNGARSGLGTTAACKSFRNWRWGNTTPGATYAYEIRFRDPRTGDQCRIDPFVRNG